MPYVKLDTKILDSSTWLDFDARQIFITGLLLALPHEVKEPTPQLDGVTGAETGWVVPPGVYGLVRSSGSNLTFRAFVGNPDFIDDAQEALRRLGEPDPESRSQEFEGRRLVRVDGGYLVLNFIRYREYDHTAAERSRRYRKKKAASRPSRRDDTPERRDDTQGRRQKAEGIEEPEIFTLNSQDAQPPPEPPNIEAGEYDKDPGFVALWEMYPRKAGKHRAHEALLKARKKKGYPGDEVVMAVLRVLIDKEWSLRESTMIPHCSTWLNGEGWEDVPAEVKAKFGRGGISEKLGW
jgi:hypothetical protein